MLQDLKLVLQAENKQLAIRYAQLRAGLQVRPAHTGDKLVSWCVPCRQWYTSGSLSNIPIMADQWMCFPLQVQ